MTECAPVLRIQVLGPFTVTSRTGEPVVLAGKLRSLLAALAVGRGAAVSSDRLVEVLWDERPPPSARTTLRGNVRRLRGVLRRLAGGSDTVLRSAENGYWLDVGPEAVDLHRFRQLREEASRAPDAAGERALLREALGLFRGEALCDVGSDTLRRDVAAVVDEERTQAAHRLVELELRGGDHEEAVALARQLTAARPLHERSWYALLLALERAGRTAEALERYEHARALFAEELGVGPGAELRRLHERLLAADAGGPAAVVSPSGDGARPPRQVPIDVTHFCGRSRALAALDAVCRPGLAAAPPVVVEGAAGIGKTALAVHWAHRSAGRFPDGQLYVDLRGFGPGRPVEPGEALGSLLRGLGLPDAQIPRGAADRAALFRSRTAGSRMLVLLDNAVDSAQACPLLPAQSCLAVVTSRRALRDLVAHHGAARIPLGPLDERAAGELLDRGLGAARAAADPGGRKLLADLAGGVPLVIRLISAFASRYPGTPLTELARTLHGDAGLDLLAGDGPDGPGLRQAWLHSWERLDPGARAMFAALGACLREDGGAEFSVDEAAFRAGLPWRRAFRDLDALVALHFVEPVGPFRFRVPALLRRYAMDVAALPGARRGG
ncbi:AfsR/SARP family transcriptional regulator [Streptomyces sp. 7-21]|uniref:AfsR/SARP family transcriptional regulator n=1 Tax=Streptomyces sp. 7-21 TaxID=2802283 RepID=UPI00191D9E70|nr:AfsR/SARP family transcriptional regulator [Streptomyces sp. 7-21]MBL1066678.1 AfsR/SARP family transcriptional regulator [Streptomyces sp. 7-21]